MTFRYKLMATTLLVATAGTAHAAPEQGAAAQPNVGVDEIVVTAQKRSESSSNVGMAITAATGEQLKIAGVTGVAGLSKIEPSFVATNSNYGAPIYAIRGISYNDYALAASPVVSVYSDEVPYAYPALSKGATFDLERVEVLKGPQGTLYGQNSTGGAVNYISAKPTRHFEAGLGATYGSFNAVNFNGFVSGPLGDTLAARLAFNVDEGGAWQRSTTRDDKQGNKDVLQGRLILDWKPTDRLSIMVNINGFRDRSESGVAQLLALTPTKPGHLGTIPSLANAQVPPPDNQWANWQPGTHPRLNERYVQGSVRAEYRISDRVLLTYLGSYEHYDQDDLLDPAATEQEVNYLFHGAVRSNNQEIRLSGDLADRKVIWVAGATYERNTADERQVFDLTDSTNSYSYVDQHLPGVTTPYKGYTNVSSDVSRNVAGFANIEFHPIDRLSLHGGLRYTETDIDHGGCTLASATSVAGNNAYEQALINAHPGTGPFVPIPVGGCYTLGPNLTPEYVQTSLDQHNISWRVGADWKPITGTLLYASISRGFKAGSFPTQNSTTYTQFKPAVQESLLAYEVGAKSRFWGGRVVMDGALFYYDYKDKQLQGRTVDPILSIQSALVNIPHSYEYGAELNIKAKPTPHLTFNLAGTYLKSAILGDVPGYDGFGVPVNFKGDSFPNAPKFTGLADVQYSWDIGSRCSAFLGVNVRYRTRTQSQLGTYGFASATFPAPSTEINAYALVGLRAGIESGDGRWRFQVFGNNVTNTYYWTYAAKQGDVTLRYPGMLATFGITLDHRY